MREIVGNLIEDVDAVHHLVILGDDVTHEVILLVLANWSVVGCTGIVSQTAGLTKLLEDDGIHAATIILIEERNQGTVLHIALLSGVLVRTQIDVLGIVRSDINLVLLDFFHLVLLALRNGSKLLGCLVLLGEQGVELLLAVRTVVGHGVLHVVQSTQKIDELLRIQLAQVSGLDGVAGWVIGTVGAVVPEIAEV